MNAWRNMIRAALVMLVFALLFTALMAGTFSVTQMIVAKNEKHAKLALLEQVLPHEGYDNELLASAITLTLAESKMLGNDTVTEVYRAQRNGKTEAIILEATARDGYAGKIKLLIGIDRNGVVQGVRVLAHKETPGLGDYIELAKSDWILQFNGKSLQNPESAYWRVKKDGGAFDYMSGATITPRAVVRAVHQALHFVTTQQDRLFA